MRYQFGSGRSQLPFESSYLTIAADGGNVTAPITRYFALLGENPAGVNLLSAIVGPVVIDAGGQLMITLPAAVRRSGEAWESFVIAGSNTNAPNSFVQLAKIAAVDESGMPVALPLSVNLLRDEDFVLSGIVATPAALPPVPCHGMLRAVTSLNSAVFEYQQNSGLPANGTTVLEAIDGAWLLKPGNFSVYVASTVQPGGCDRSLDLLSLNLQSTPRYTCTGAVGRLRVFWLYNNESEPVEAGRRVGLSVAVNDVPQGNAFNGLLHQIFLGYSNLSTGDRRTAFADGEEFEDFNVSRGLESGKTDLVLPDDLALGEACAVAVYPNFAIAELNNQVPIQGILSVAPFIFLQSGSYSAVGQALGDWIYPKFDRGLVVPTMGLGLKALKRSGNVSSREFLQVGPTFVSGLDHDTPNQIIAINSNGAVFRRSGELQPGEAQRAIVSTAAGISAACDLSSPITLTDGQGLRVTLNYPSNGTTAQIRSNYPDALLAGVSGKAQLNATQVVIYIKIGSIIKQFEGLLLLDGASQTLDLSDWNTGETIASVPAATSIEFGLFQPLSAAAISNGAGNFPAGAMQIAFAFQYDGGAVSSISHDAAQGCIDTASLTIAKIEQSARAWAPPAFTVTALRQVRPETRSPYQSRYVAEKGNPYRWHPESLQIDDGDGSVTPNDLDVSQSGRWLKDDSSQILTGNLPPTAALGEVGDYYLVRDPANAAFGNLYTKTSFLDWTLVANLRGATGPKGIEPRGEWSAEASYDAPNLVGRRNSVYLAIVPSLNIDPAEDNGTHWQILVRGIEDRGSWAEGLTYRVNNLVRRASKVWLSRSINTGVDPLTDNGGTNWRILTQDVRPRGLYRADTAYALNDLVFDSVGSHLYIAPTPTTGTPTNNADYWQTIALNGEAGASFNPRGEYNFEAVYRNLDVVGFHVGDANGGTYVYINGTPSSGNAPPDPVYWQRNAQDGQKGDAATIDSALSAILLDVATTAPTTSATQLAVWNNGGVLEQRAPNNGASTPIAPGGGGDGGGNFVRWQIFN